MVVLLDGLRERKRGWLLTLPVERTRGLVARKWKLPIEPVSEHVERVYSLPAQRQGITLGHGSVSAPLNPENRLV